MQNLDTRGLAYKRRTHGRGFLSVRLEMPNRDDNGWGPLGKRRSIFGGKQERRNPGEVHAAGEPTMPLRGRRGTIWAFIVAALLTGLEAFFLMMNDLNQVMRGVGQTPPEVLAEQKSDPTPRSGADVYGTKHE